jgi:hypothetical protein
MGSRLTYYGSSSSIESIPTKSISIPANTIVSLPVSKFAEFPKFEIEYSFKIGGAVNKIETGRITCLYNGSSIEILSHEIENSNVLGEQSVVSIEPYILVDDIGLQINNTSLESFVFYYQVNNKMQL